jgi:hypothetical protein
MHANIKLAAKDGKLVEQPKSKAVLLRGVKKLKVLLAQADQANARAEALGGKREAELATAKQRTVEAGGVLIGIRNDHREAKKAGTIKQTWAAFVKNECGLSRERADGLIRIAGGTTTVEKERERRKQSVRKSRAKRVLQSGGSTHSADDDEGDFEADIKAENYLTAFMLRADQAVQFAVYSGPITKDVVAAARRAATAWTKLTQQLEEKL